MTNNASDDVSKRTGRMTSTLEKVSAYKTYASQAYASLKSLPQVDLAQAKIDLKQKKNIIVVLVALNTVLVGLTAGRDEAIRVQQAQAIESVATREADMARTITVQPVQAPEAQVAVVEAEEVIPTPTPTPVTQVAGVSVSRGFYCQAFMSKRYEGNAGAMVRQAATARWSADQANSLMQLMGRESGLNPYSCNVSSGACGIPQAYPCEKLIRAIGSLDNVEGQVEWLMSYVANRYGTPAAAIAHHNVKGWY